MEKNSVGRPRKIESPQEMWDAFEFYIELCADHKTAQLSNKGEVIYVPTPRVPTLGKFCTILKIDTDTWGHYKEREEFCGTIKKIEKIILSAKHDALVNGEGNTTGLIFDLKCNEGWKDKQIIEHEGEITVTLNLNK
jgi:hypothetical protein